MNYDEIKKYEGYIRYLATRKASRYVDAEDLISAAYEKLIKVKIREKNAYKKYVECMIRHAMYQEMQAHHPKPFRRKMKMPEHLQFDDLHAPPEGAPENHTKRIYEKEKVKEILNHCTPKEKEFISLFLKDLSMIEIARVMKISSVSVHQIRNNIKNNPLLKT